ncbi:MAG: phage holin family protein [Tannerellaceae bacterium]|nr:phage holin family protein [Tannerellaceae bacterium]
MDPTYTDQFLRGLVEFIEWAKWLLLLAFCLTMGDLKFGIAAARYRQEPIKRSRAVRRTVDKICSYLIWLLMAYTFGEAFGKPFGIDLVPLMLLLIIYGVELESIFVNYFAAHGRKIKINLLGFFGKKAEIIEIEKTDEPNENH